MSRTLARLLSVGAATATVATAVLITSAGAASAAPACDDAVVGVLHAAHDTSGDPAGLIHEVEETYCSVG